MRERIVGSFVLLVLGILVAFSLTRAYTADAAVNAAATRQTERGAELLAELVTSRVEADQPLDTAYLRDQLGEGERVDYVAADGTTLEASGPGYRVEEQDTDITNTQAVGGGGTLTLRSSQYLIDERVSAAITSLVLLGAVLVIVSVALAFGAAQRLAQPFRELAGFAVALGRGRFDLGIPPYAVPEADTIGRALQQSAGQLQDLVRREREFASNVSHQLRTPITALRLGLEDVSMWPETPTSVREELRWTLGQVDRLETTINDLLDLARSRRIGGSADIDLADLVEQSVERWRAAAGTRELALDVPGPVPVHQAPGPLEQILDVLVDNALRHGGGTVTVAVLDAGEHVEVRVGDQGRARPGDEVFHRNVGSTGDGLGIGLTVAAEIAEALGGRLGLADTPTTTFRLQLPRR